MPGLALFITALIGLALLARGLVGRAVGDEPRCARCRYDLSGLTGETTACPECGRSLTRAGAVRRGTRRRARLPLATGIALLAIPLAAGAAFIWGEAAGHDWNRTNPTWLLLRELEAHGGNWTAADTRVDILVDRLTDRKLTDQQIARFVDVVLRTGDRYVAADQPPDVVWAVVVLDHLLGNRALGEPQHVRLIDWLLDNRDNRVWDRSLIYDIERAFTVGLVPHRQLCAAVEPYMIGEVWLSEVAAEPGQELEVRIGYTSNRFDPELEDVAWWPLASHPGAMWLQFHSPIPSSPRKQDVLLEWQYFPGKDWNLLGLIQSRQDQDGSSPFVLYVPYSTLATFRAEEEPGRHVVNATIHWTVLAADQSPENIRQEAHPELTHSRTIRLTYEVLPDP